MKTLVTGAKGLVGSAVVKRLPNDTISIGNIGPSEGWQYDLREWADARNMFLSHDPDYVIHAAAKVGGVGGNAKNHATYFIDNIRMNTNVIEMARNFDVKKLIAFSSVCAYPDGIGVLKEENIHNGPPSPFNFAYAYAKRMLDVQIEAYEKQYDTKNFCAATLCNVFGENDNYNLSTGHVIPSLIHKLYLAMTDDTPFVVWGTGIARREFIFSDDLARIIVDLLDIENIPRSLIISNPQEYTIKQVVDILVEVSGFKGKVVWDQSKPDGQHSRPTDTSLLHKLLTPKYTPLDTALERSWLWFKEKYELSKGGTS